jgi:hypothetical protein
MQAFNFTRQLRATAFLMLIGAGVSAHAATLSVSCGEPSGLTTINAAIKLLQSNQSLHPATVNVSGACHENVVIQSIDRLTLNAVNGASITDASGGTLDVVQIADSRSVSINNFTINGAANIRSDPFLEAIPCWFHSCPGMICAMMRVILTVVPPLSGCDARYSEIARYCTTSRKIRSRSFGQAAKLASAR